LDEHGIDVDFEALKSGQSLDKNDANQKATDKGNFRKFKLDAEFDTGLPEGQTPLRKVQI
jgi:hypothetical protein